jgi:predicted PurR-regulated permease PerM
LRRTGARILDLWLIWLKGQFLLSCIMGGATWAMGSAMGLSYAGILGVVAGVMELVPQIGPVVAIVPAAAVALWRGSSVIPVPNWAFALMVIAAYLALQQVGNWVVQPQLMGRRLKLPPLLVLAAVLVGTLLGGIVGTILAVPVLATLWELIATLQGSSRSPVSSEPLDPPE